MKKFTLFVTTIFMIFTMFLVGCDKKEENKSLELSVREFNKYGNVILETTFDDLKNNNIEPADIITINIGEDSYNIPVGTEYSDVDSGSMICRFDTEDSKVILAINGGNFATTTKMATKETIEEEPGYKWNVSIDKVTLTLKEKNGYKDEYTIRHLERTNERSDYSDLSDDDYANCRVINVTGIKENTLYRGTTPLADDLARNTYAMNFLSANNIRSIINLADSNEEMLDYTTYEGSYYASCNIGNIVTNYDFTNVDFANKVKECVNFIINNEGPYYIHCKEGKDRTGMLCAILECFVGGTYEEIALDYMKTYINFYHVAKDSEVYNIVLNKNFEKVLCEMFDVTSLKEASLANEAKEYLLASGLTNDDLNALSLKLGA